MWFIARTAVNLTSLFVTAGVAFVVAGKHLVAKANHSNVSMPSRIMSVDAHDKAQAKMEDAIHAYERAMDGDGQILTAWIVVAEWINSDGEEELAAFSSPGLPYWKANGMLEAAPYEIVYEEDDID